MRKLTPHTVARSMGALAAVTLASCSLPSQEEWQQIRKDGLIPYVINNRHQTAAEEAPQQVAQHSAPPAPAGATVVRTTPPRMAASPSIAGSNVSVPPPSQLHSDALLTAQAIPGLAGYVRSPFTNPPRLVDVRGMSAGSKVVCPYTRKPFLVPAGAVEAAPQQQVASAPAPAPLPKPQPQPQAVPAPAPKVTQQAPVAPTKVAVNSAPAPQPPPQPQAKATPPVVQQTPPPAPAQAELPFGIAIPGRPGFVNSPYAAKHQLVDVTGLPTGMEVKCPYTGKLFRVPPQADGSAPPK
ncbi:MAG: hypothetical protein JWO94_1613 [Verrucomicrobiaceae bacterium]|nr:hypothetical protein [Verrucomicrobiaceae bacterium]